MNIISQVTTEIKINCYGNKALVLYLYLNIVKFLTQCVVINNASEFNVFNILIHCTIINNNKTSRLKLRKMHITRFELYVQNKDSELFILL